MASEMVECSDWKDGFDHYLPHRVEVEHLNEAVSRLRKAGVLLGQSQPAFASYTDSPVNMRQREELVFQPLVNICKLLGTLKLEGVNATCELVHRPHHYSKTETARHENLLALPVLLERRSRISVVRRFERFGSS